MEGSYGAPVTFPVHFYDQEGVDGAKGGRKQRKQR